MYATRTVTCLRHCCSLYLAGHLDQHLEVYMHEFAAAVLSGTVQHQHNDAALQAHESGLDYDQQRVNGYGPTASVLPHAINGMQSISRFRVQIRYFTHPSVATCACCGCLCLDVVLSSH
jgi:hypothetical protein